MLPSKEHEEERQTDSQPDEQYAFHEVFSPVVGTTVRRQWNRVAHLGTVIQS
jgi:hypothetical protein